jgi:glutamate racemase
MKIGFFDSGLGGLTVLKEAIENEKLSEDIYYLGDTKNTPYGTKDEGFVRKIIKENIDYLVKLECNPIVIACNTATSLCINELREKYKKIVFIGTEPAVKVAADSKDAKKILVLATSITVRQEKLHSLINRLNIEDNVELVAADKLVKFAENINCNNMNEEIEEYIKSLIGKYNLDEFSHIVLGCTHFPLFKENFKRVINKINPNLNIHIVDGAKGISNNLIRYINKIKGNDSYIPDTKHINVITTSKNNDFIIRTKQILNNENINFEYKLQ